MSIMTFNEFQRALQKRGIEPKVAYMFTLIYEQMVELSKHGDEAAVIMLDMARAMEGIVGLHETTKSHVEALARRGQTDGIDVASVANEPEES